MRRFLVLVGVAWWLAAPPASAAPADDPPPLLGEGTVAIARIDLSKLEAAGLARRLHGVAADAPDFPLLIKEVDDRAVALRQAGAGPLYLVFDLDDMPGPPILAVAVGPAADRDKVRQLITASLPGLPRAVGAAGLDLPGWVVVAARPTLDRLKAPRPSVRPDLVAALDAGAADTPIRVAVSPGATFRRAIEEAMPDLPAALGGGPVEAMTREAAWMLLEIPRGNGNAARATLRARSPDAAADLARRFGLATEAGRAGPAGDLALLLGGIDLRATGDDVVADLGLAQTYTLLATPVGLARDRSRRAQTVNNLKQMALAMHNYHSAYKAFPPAFRAGPDGRPLLSWRVLILPFVEEQKLYDEFHLDEPWDSPHNKALIPRMPKVFASPLAAPGLAAEGKTAYLTPRGAKTMFPGGRGMPISEVTDGTSNTILVIEAADSEAVTWTKPDDWDADRRPDLPPRRKDTAFGDGSVRSIKLDIKPDFLRKLLTASGNEVISAEEF